jgi:MoxR-like ATPase
VTDQNNQPTNASDEDIQAAERLAEAYKTIREEMSRAIVGQEEVLEQLLTCIFARGHAILEGVPGLAKTLMVSSLAQCLDLDFARIQFTPDLMPSDITGTEVIQEDKATGHREFKFLQGPIFNNIILADEINRTPPKTQAALLEAMQERQISVGGQRMPMGDPFFVLATQNPIEQEGTYPLPEIQQDRFMFSLYIDYLPKHQELEVVNATTGASVEDLEVVMSGEELLAYQQIVRQTPVADAIIRYAVALAARSRPDEEGSPDFVGEYVSWGASIRASHYLILGAKARAVLAGRPHVAVKDVQSVALPVLRHRILTNFRAESEGIRSEDIVQRLLDTVPTPTSGLE